MLPTNAWRKKLKHVDPNRWDCHCENVVSAKSKNKWIDQIDTALDLSNQELSRAKHSLDIAGLTSAKVKHFLNNLCNADDVRYLEVGVFQGATFSAAIEGNSITAHALDNWQDQTINPARDVEGWTAEKGDAKQIFQNNVQQVIGENTVTGHDYDGPKFDINTIARLTSVYDADPAEGTFFPNTLLVCLKKRLCW